MGLLLCSAEPATNTANVAVVRPLVTTRGTKSRKRHAQLKRLPRASPDGAVDEPRVGAAAEAGRGLPGGRGDVEHSGRGRGTLVTRVWGWCWWRSFLKPPGFRRISCDCSNNSPQHVKTPLPAIIGRGVSVFRVEVSTCGSVFFFETAENRFLLIASARHTLRVAVEKKSRLSKRPSVGRSRVEFPRGIRQ